MKRVLASGSASPPETCLGSREPFDAEWAMAAGRRAGVNYFESARWLESTKPTQTIHTIRSQKPKPSRDQRLALSLFSSMRYPEMAKTSMGQQGAALPSRQGDHMALGRGDAAGGKKRNGERGNPVQSAVVNLKSAMASYGP
jgi:hypothetical protein